MRALKNAMYDIRSLATRLSEPKPIIFRRRWREREAVLDEFYKLANAIENAAEDAVKNCVSCVHGRKCAGKARIDLRASDDQDERVQFEGVWCLHHEKLTMTTYKCVVWKYNSKKDGEGTL